MSESKSKAPGELSVVEERTQLDTQSSNEEHRPNISGMSASSQIPPISQIGFQPTKTLGEVDETTTNAKILTAFVDKLGALVEWRSLSLADGRKVFALCFPADKWQIEGGELVPVRSAKDEK